MENITLYEAMQYIDNYLTEKTQNRYNLVSTKLNIYEACNAGIITEEEKDEYLTILNESALDSIKSIFKKKSSDDKLNAVLNKYSKMLNDIDDSNMSEDESRKKYLKIAIQYFNELNKLAAAGNKEAAKHLEAVKSLIFTLNPNAGFVHYKDGKQKYINI